MPNPIPDDALAQLEVQQTFRRHHTTSSATPRLSRFRDSLSLFAAVSASVRRSSSAAIRRASFTAPPRSPQPQPTSSGAGEPASTIATSSCVYTRLSGHPLKSSSRMLSERAGMASQARGACRPCQLRGAHSSAAAVVGFHAHLPDAKVAPSLEKSQCCPPRSPQVSGASESIERSNPSTVAKRRASTLRRARARIPSALARKPATCSPMALVWLTRTARFRPRLAGIGQALADPETHFRPAMLSSNQIVATQLAMSAEKDRIVSPHLLASQG